MGSAVRKNALREIRSTFGRFFAIMAIIALGVGFFTGVRIVTPAMVNTVNKFLDENQFYDYRLLSSIGWKEEDVSINKGEKAITILEPGNEYTREDGSTGFSINVKKVFDISQTSSGNVSMRRRKPDPREAIKALIASSPCEVALVEKLNDASARYSPDKNVIYVVKGLEADEIFRVLSYEIGIAKAAQKDIDRKDGAFSAYCASYILCERNGFDVGDFNFDRVSERFADVDNKDVRKELGEIRDLANDISQDMNRQFEAMEKSKRSRDDGAR